MHLCVAALFDLIILNIVHPFKRSLPINTVTSYSQQSKSVSMTKFELYLEMFQILCEAQPDATQRIFGPKHLIVLNDIHTSKKRQKRKPFRVYPINP